ncbi:hypothetical protein F2P56_012136 [Juglans regia]|uniref:B-like cyclin n=1 Tax=Juglans regia TaxID=51240 RepID=A0A833XLK8_JUGRE|nr:hypothetical protein F2P56_012136 [Juglans regia]
MGKATLAKKRAPLSNLTNVKNVANVSSRTSVPYSALVSSASKIAKAKKGPPANIGSTGLPRTNFPASLNLKSTAVVPCSKVTSSISRSDGNVPNTVAIPAQFSMDVSPSKSDGLSVSMDESMSTCDSFKSPEVEYMDNSDVPAVPSLQLECLANYIAELSLLEYNMLCYAPSLLAASAIFMAKYILFPSQKPWNSTLQHYTIYKPSDLCNCVKDLHRLCCDSHTSSLPAIKEKYSQHKYKYVAKKYCPPTIPAEFFQN